MAPGNLLLLPSACKNYFNPNLNVLGSNNTLIYGTNKEKHNYMGFIRKNTLTQQKREFRVN